MTFNESVIPFIFLTHAHTHTYIGHIPLIYLLNGYSKKKKKEKKKDNAFIIHWSTKATLQCLEYLTIK